MEGIRYVLVEPEYPINIGLCARVLKNFGLKRIYAVNPKCPINKTAFMFAKHGKDLLENIVLVKTINDAVKGCKFIVGTTSVLKRHKGTIRNPLTLKELKQRKFDGAIAILFGREGIGLTEKEINLCDFLVTIPAISKYPVLNLSHAVAITAYELSDVKFGRRHDEKGKKNMIKMYDELVDSMSKKVQKPWKFKVAFRRVVGRAAISEDEVSILTGMFSYLRKDLKRLARQKEKSGTD